MATVLVVDDRATNREIARTTLDYGGYDVIEASGGGQALELAGRFHPDVVLADVVMPGMDGYEFVHHLRADAGTADIPVVLYSANYRPDEAEPLARAYGVVKVVPKSAEPPQLLAAIDEALRSGAAAPPAPPALAADEHLRAVSAKLVEKVLALDESEARFTALAEVSPVGIAIGDAGLNATYVNPSLTAITGIPAAGLLGAGWRRCLPSGETGTDGTVETVSYHGEVDLDGRRRWLNVVVRRLADRDDGNGFVAIVSDVSPVVEAEQRRHAADRAREAEARQQMQQRFASLARMSGAVAHDLNNLLNVVLSFAEFAREAVEDSAGTTLSTEQAGRIVGDLDRVAQAGGRVEQLGRQLLTVGGREIVQPAVISVNDVVREAREAIAERAGELIVTVTRLDPGLPSTYADAAQLRQVLLNLVANAVEAMPDGGRLTVTTALDGHEVHLSVADTGVGMPPEVADRAMEPFFTTKPKGLSAGLGLATAYGVVGQAGGTLSLDSTPGGGTTVHIRLRATDDPAAPGSLQSGQGRWRGGRTGRAPEPAPTHQSGEHTVLLAEDEEGVREVASRILRQAGYRVLAAADGEAALALAEDHDGPIHGLLSDVVMPRVNGPQLAEALRRTRPGIPVLFMSGYAAPLMTEEGLLPPGVTVVSKPFTKSTLLDAVTATLGSAAAR